MHEFDEPDTERAGLTVPVTGFTFSTNHAGLLEMSITEVLYFAPTSSSAMRTRCETGEYYGHC